MTKRDLLIFFFKQLKVISLVFFTIVTLTVIMQYVQDPTFMGQATILIERNRAPAMRNTYSPGLDLVEVLNTESKIILSRTVMTEVVDTLKPHKRPKRDTMLRRMIAGTKRYFQDLGLLLVISPRDKWIEYLMKEVKIKPAINSNILDIKYYDDNPEWAAKIMSSIVASFVQHHMRVYSAHGAAKLYQSQISRLQGNLAGSRAALAGHKKNIADVNQRGSELYLAQMSRLQKDLSRKRVELVGLKQDLADVDLNGAELYLGQMRRIEVNLAKRRAGLSLYERNISVGGKSPREITFQLGAVREELKAARQQLAGLLARFEPGHKDIIALKANISQLVVSEEQFQGQFELDKPMQDKMELAIIAEQASYDDYKKRYDNTRDRKFTSVDLAHLARILRGEILALEAAGAKPGSNPELASLKATLKDADHQIDIFNTTEPLISGAELDLVEIGSRYGDYKVRYDAARSLEFSRADLAHLSRILADEIIMLEEDEVTSKLAPDARVALKQTISALQATKLEAEAQIVKIDANEPKLAEIELGLRSDETTLVDYKKQYDKAHISELANVDLINVRIVDYPQVPGHPVRSRLFYILISAVIALFLAISLAALYEYFDRSLSDPHLVEQHLGIPELGYVEAFSKCPYQLENEYRAEKSQQRKAQNA